MYVSIDRSPDPELCVLHCIGDVEEVKCEATRIFDRFIAPDAVEQVNLPPTIMRTLDVR